MGKATVSRATRDEVLVGPKLIGDYYYRIVSQHDRRGRVERYDPKSCSWTAAPRSMTFRDVSNAPAAPQWLLDLLRRSSPFEDPGGAAL